MTRINAIKNAILAAVDSTITNYAEATVSYKYDPVTCEVDHNTIVGCTASIISGVDLGLKRRRVEVIVSDSSVRIVWAATPAIRAAVGAELAKAGRAFRR